MSHDPSTVTVPVELFTRLANIAAYYEQDKLLSQYRGPNHDLRSDLRLAGTAIFNATGTDPSAPRRSDVADGRYLLKPDRRRPSFGRTRT